MIVEVCGLTDVGRKRDLNEDSYKICGFENGKAHGFCVLADGMGGHNAGEVASANAVKLISEELMTIRENESDKKVNLNIASAIDFANSQIYDMSITKLEHAGMGTTMVIAYIDGKNVRIANIGDSRAYVISNGEIQKITVDHSVVEQLVQSGTISPEEAKMHPDKNIITRALGTEEYVDADFYEYEASSGDVIVMCSDGLTEMVEEKEIKKVFEYTQDEVTAVKTLVEMANERGGVDNITVIAVRFKEEEIL